MRKGLACLLAVLSVGVGAVAPCYFSDSPDCACFNDTATWNPSGVWIQDIALDTVGTIVSCVTKPICSLSVFRGTSCTSMPSISTLPRGPS